MTTCDRSTAIGHCRLPAVAAVMNDQNRPRRPSNIRRGRWSPPRQWGQHCLDHLSEWFPEVPRTEVLAWLQRQIDDATSRSEGNRSGIATLR